MPPSDPSQIPIAVVGMACRLPGADNLEEYWQLLVNGRSAVVELPPDRLDQSLYFDPREGVLGKTYSKLGAILNSREFDRSRCPIPEALAQSVDNVHLLMCDVAASALRHAGYDPFALLIRNTGVYVGHAQGSTLGGDQTYATLIEEAAEFLRETPQFQRLSPQNQAHVLRELIERVRRPLPARGADAPDVSASLVAGVISKAFDLTGPYLAINSACASSLQALLLGARALQLGRVEMAIVGGASDCKSDSLVLFSHARAMSATGSRPFDSEADGLIVGEGYVAVVLKRLDRAVADGDRVWGLVRGIGVSSDGKGKSLWAPRKEGQVKAMQRAYRGGIDMADVDYIEAHATATQLGDATELNTLTELFVRHFPPGKRVPVTSVKANIGHTLETAGLAGVVKTLLAMHYQTIPPAINIRTLNPQIDWQRTPIYVPTSPTPWPLHAGGKPRRAGVNAFGIGGLNMHVVLDEYTASSRALVNGSTSPPPRTVQLDSPPADGSVAVIGLGCVLPGAGNTAEFQQVVASCRDPKVPVPADRWNTELALRSNPELRGKSLTGGFITNFEYDWKRHKLPPKQIAQADPLQFMLLEAADQALQDAGYHEREFHRENTGVVVGTEFGGDFAFQLQLGLRLPELQRHIESLLQQQGLDAAESSAAAAGYSQALLNKWPALIDETGSFSTSSLASRIGKTWNLMGGAAAIDAGHTSGLAALSTSVDMLLAGDCDLMLCAAGQRRMGLPEYEILANNGTLADADDAFSGLVPGEGVVVLLLKRLSDARRDGDRVHAVLHQVEAAHDAMEPQRALRLAVQRTQTRVSLVDVARVEFDAPDSARDLQPQLNALGSSYESRERPMPQIVDSPARQFGHLQGASSLLLVLKAIVESNSGELPVGYRRNSTAGSSLTSTPSVVPPASLTGSRMAAVASVSRGLAYHAVLESAHRESPPAQSSPSSNGSGSPLTQTEATSVDSTSKPTISTARIDELEKFLVNFVVEQTGYPPEVVELDSNLEAELGIDSIKKVQMFGELREYFDIAPTGNVTLDDFPTLRHIVDFLASSSKKEAAATSVESIPPTVVPPRPPETVEPLRAVPATSSTPSANWRIVRFSAADQSSLARAICTAQDPSRSWESYSRPAFSPGDRVRVAIVADSAETFSARLSLAARHIEQPAAHPVLEQNGIFIRRANPSTRIAFLFAGQGSQYPGMLRTLVHDLPEAAAELRRVDEVLARLRHPSWAQLTSAESSQLGKDVWATQISMLLADVLMLAALRAQGIEPDLVAGHSYGEYAALVAAGAWNLEQAVRITGQRCDAIESSLTARGGMLATSAPAQVIEELLRQVNGEVYVANLNAPDQSVVGGNIAALDQLERLLRANKFEARLLPVPCPFHTPLMREAAERFAASIHEQAFEAPRVPMYSVATNQPARTVEEIRANLVAHLVTPVRYADLIRQLATEAPTAFVEVGPQQALTRLNRKILAQDDFAGIASDNPSSPGIEQLVRVQALLECTGALDRRLQPGTATIATRVVPAVRLAGEIWHFDATARRRDNKRKAAGKGTNTATQTAVLPAGVVSSRTALEPAPPPKSMAAAGPTTAVPRLEPVTIAPPGERIAVAAARPDTQPSSPAKVTGVAEIEQFLVNFVVEQTGYPPEVVELDANLEAELGIDSIKKVQMFGELREYFDIAPTGNVTLDDFPTLRHIVVFLAKSQRIGELDAAADAETTVAEPVASANPHTGNRAPAKVSAACDAIWSLESMHLQGTPLEIGRQHGSQQFTAIRAAVRRIAELTDGDYSELPIPRDAWENPRPFFAADELAELEGMADSSGISLGNLAALNLTLRNALARDGVLPDTRCSNGSAAEAAAALREQLVLPAALLEVLRPVVVTREEAGEQTSRILFAGMVGAGTAPTVRNVAHSPREPRGPAETIAPLQIASPSVDLRELVDDSIERSEFRRYVLRICPMPWEQPPIDFPTWKGTVAITGDNPLAEALQRRLEAGGAEVLRLRRTDSIAAATAELESAYRQSPIAHLFLTSSRNAAELERTDSDSWDRAFLSQSLVPYFVCQRWLTLAGEAGRLNGCSVIAVTNLGGDLGFSGTVEAPEAGYLTGLMKSLLIEYRIMRGHDTFLAKAIDAPRTEAPDSLAANICRELAHNSKDYEVAFNRGLRYLQVALPQPARLTAESAIVPSGVWVLSGGARGITARCGIELGRRFGLKLHLLGTASLEQFDESWRDLDASQTAQLRTRVALQARAAGQNPTDAWSAVMRLIEIDRNLRAFAAAGISATYHVCDVSNRHALSTVLDRIRAADGPISGILHGAAVDRSCRFEKKSASIVTASAAAKVTGAYNLMTLTRQDPIKHFLGFGSISGRLGSNGQTDYSAASDMLCKLISWYRTLRPECRAVGFHWHPWGDAGMATRPETQAILKASNLRLMPAEVGLNHLLREVCSNSAEAEVLITDCEYHGRYYSGDSADIGRRTDLLGQPGRGSEPHNDSVNSTAEVFELAKTHIADRFVMRMADAPLSSDDNSAALPESTFLLGDNADADALSALLESRNVRVHRISTLSDTDAACAALERAWADTPARSLILTTARDPEATRIDDPGTAVGRVERGVTLPYWVARRWMQFVNQNPEAGPATIVAVTSLGGAFGFDDVVPAPEGGAIAGLLKSIYVEDERYDHSRFRVKVIDFPINEPAANVAESVCRELASNRPEVEVAWNNGRRTTVVTERVPVAAADDVTPGGNWVVTGGARGITHAAVLELGKRYRLKLHLLGASPAPDRGGNWLGCSDAELKKIKTELVRAAVAAGRSPNDDWDRVRKDREIQQSLAAFAAAGVNVTYHCCDVSKWDELSRVLDEIRAQDGPIDGIVHGAGFAKPGRFGAGIAADVPRTFAPKIDGTLALMHLTRRDPLRQFVAFGSLSGRFGGNGLSEYAMANDMLAKLCGWFRGLRPECRTTCIHWQTWDQIGMATKSDSLEISRNQFQMQFLSPDEGTEHFVREISGKSNDAEVLITDGYFQRAFYTYEMERGLTTIGKSQRPAPLVDSWNCNDSGGGVAQVLFNPQHDPFLTQHLFRQKPFLPAVIGIELLAEAARCASGSASKVIQNVRIPNGLMFRSDEPREARVAVTQTANGRECRLLTELRDRQGRMIDGNRLQVEGLVPSNRSQEAIVAEPPGQPVAWLPHIYSDEAALYHGPVFRCLHEIALQYDGGWGRVVATPLSDLAGPRGDDGWLLSPAVLDACLVACGGFLWMQFGGAFEVPYGFEQITWSRQPRSGEACLVRFFFRERGPKHSRFDFTLYGEDSQPILQAIGYQTIRVGGGE